MKLTCPKCHSQSIVADEKVPRQGAWARCPKCSERFFIRPNSEVALSTPVPPVQNFKREPRSPEAQQMINRLKGRQPGQDQDDSGFDPAYITIFPEPAAPLFPYFVALGIVAVAAIGLTLFFFNSAGEKALITQAPPRQAGIVKSYGNEELRQDLLTLRRRFRSKPNLNYSVDFTGTESRMFKYLLTRLAPHSCAEVTRLQLTSSRPDQEIEIRADCLDSRYPSPLLRIQWRQGKALISFENVNDQLSLEMFPESNPSQETGRT